MSNYSVFNSILVTISVLLACAWLLYGFQLYRLQRGFPVISSRNPLSASEDSPLVSIIVAAKDEQENIESCINSLLSQTYAQFEVIVVNDRSSDNTAALVENLRQQHPDRLKVISISQVPEGWGGQNHALWQGVQASQGEWLCFTDADCRFLSTKTLTSAMYEVRYRKLDLLSVFPTVVLSSFWEKMYLPLCVLVLLTRLKISDTNDRSRPGAYANGAFMLMHRDAYQELGGHEKVRSQVNDDVCLARLAKQAGKSVFIMASEDFLSTKMYSSLTASWFGWTRNFTGTLKTPGNLLWAFASSAVLFVMPWLGLLLTIPVMQIEFYALLLVVILSQIVMWRVYQSYPVNPLWSLLYFPGAILVVLILANALVRSWRYAAIEWHGVKYPAGNDKKK
jgi:GT2 family glycosyltransferase